MSELRELYQEQILEHSKTPRNFRELQNANHKAEGYNPLCGDHFTIYLDLEGDKIHDVTFQGSGCAISKASASMMTQSVKGKSKEEAAKIFENFHNLVTGQADGDQRIAGQAGSLRRRLGISRPREMRHPRLAHFASRTGRQAGKDLDRISTVQPHHPGQSLLTSPCGIDH